jgi:hypothetical protein
MIELLALRQLLEEEMSNAEARTRQSISLNLPNAKEDEVTALLVVEAGKGLREATENGRVAAAVRTDLEYGYAVRGRSAPTHLWHLTDGLIARLHRHGLKGETRTGGDFGLLLIEPQFDLGWGHELGLQRSGLKRAGQAPVP